MYHESMLYISEHTNKFQAHKIGLDAMDAKLRLDSIEFIPIGPCLKA